MRALIVGLALALVSPARAAVQPPIVVMTALVYHYVPGDLSDPQLTLSVAQGSTLEFANADIDAHSVTASTFDSHGNPIFTSDTINGEQVSPVRGVEFLPPGSYPFGCAIHEFMHGTLVVT